MTESEKLQAELELLQLEEEEAAQQKPREPHGASGSWAPEPDKEEAFYRGLTQGVTLGTADEMSAGVNAARRKFLPAQLGGDESPRGFLETYREERGKERASDNSARKAHGGYYLAGDMAGGLATAPLMPAAGSARTLGQLIKSGAGTGALAAGLSGLGSSEAELTPDKISPGSALRAAVDTGANAVAGGLIGGTLPVVGRAASSAANILGKLRKGGYVNPSPEARRLAAEGIEMTLGQMDPPSTYGRVEELAANQATGGSLSTARKRTEGSARDLLLRKAGLPGAKSPTAGASVAQQIQEIEGGFSDAYSQALDNVFMAPEKYAGQGKWRGLLSDPSLKGSAKLKGAFELAAEAKNIDATPGVRRRALDWLSNEARSLSPTKSGPNAGMVEGKSVQALRTRLRDRIRGLGDEGDDRQLREIYGRAEEFVSELLDGSLPPERAALLRNADANYRNLLAVERAAGGSAAFKNKGEFTPDQLLEVIRKKGATPGLESTAKDAHAVLSATYRPTGIQVAANEAFPLLKKAGPAWAALANASPELRAHALGQGAMPSWASAPIGFAEGTGRLLEGVSSTPARAALIRALSLSRALRDGEGQSMQQTE